MAKNEIEQKTKEIERIYADYLADMNKLKEEQDNLLNDFLKELEKIKLEEIRNKIKE